MKWYVPVTDMRTKATMAIGIRPCNYQKTKVELKSTLASRRDLGFYVINIKRWKMVGLWNMA